MTRRAVITGWGAYLPQHIVTNDDLAKTIDTNDAWIRERTGICQRHIAAKDELTSDLAAHAARKAITKAGIAPETIDLVIVATTTPDDTLPATAAKVQHKIGITGGAAFDINAVCSGFLYGLSTADAYIAAGKAKTILVVGAETYSRILDWQDRGTCILFGDGAGAVILQAQQGAGTNDDAGILHTEIFSDGQYAPLLGSSGGVSSTQNAGYLFMQGKEIFRHAVSKMTASVEHSLQHIGLNSDDIQWLVPHQANMRILQATAKRLNIPEERVILTVDKHANTSAASIPLALSLAADEGKFSSGDLIAIPALGAGLTWGSCLLRWTA
ncbi:MAG: ketoacyl-ACP synthase III [Alphaproteobacteria bacterium]|nr:ketoacyl-ACP synthase III [Alphaproteobacteria bacterium]